MPFKRRYSAKRKFAPRRKRSTTKRSSKFARRQQKSEMTWIRKKYTRTFTLDALTAADNAFATISLIGGKNNQDPTNTVTLFDNNQDSQLAGDMRLYQFFRIRGVAVKLFFPMPTTENATPCQWSLAYSQSEILAPQLPTTRVQTLATYQTGPCNQNKSISRYYNTASTYRRFGIQYCSTDEFSDFNTSSALYGGSLPSDAGSSV